MLPINLSKDKEEEKYNFQLLFKKDQIDNDITANYNVMIENVELINCVFNHRIVENKNMIKYLIISYLIYLI